MTDDDKSSFCKYITAGCNEGFAASRVQATLREVYQLQQSDPNFARNVLEAKSFYMGLLKDLAHQKTNAQTIHGDVLNDIARQRRKLC